MNRPAIISLFAIWIVFIPAQIRADQVVPSDRVQSHVNIHRLANSQSPTVGQLRPGESLAFVQSVPRWHEVRLGDGGTGFVSKSWSRIVPEGLAARQLDELRIHFLNVGAGTCTIVECPGADNPPPMIVDCGSLAGTVDDMDRDAARQRIQEILGARSPNLVLSHGDRDHYGWISTVLADIQVQNIWQGGDPDEYTEDEFPVWLADQQANGATVHQKFLPNFHNDDNPIGEELHCGDASVFILTVNTGSSKNAQSLMLEIHKEDFSVFFTGDAEGRTERQARDNFDGNVDTTVLVGSHHGARTHGSNSATWAAATDPEVVIFSAGRRFGHPQCDAVNRYLGSVSEAPRHPIQCGEGSTYQPVRNSTDAVYTTEINGEIVITSSGRSPLSLFCTRSEGCNARIPH